ncbi:MAG: hypothetical protein WA116_05505 [Anaerolineaceae bacterium]
MKLSAPKSTTFIIALVLVLVGVLGKLDIIGAVAQYDFWLVLAGFVLLALANLLNDL